MLPGYRENGLTFREVREIKKQMEEAAAAAQIEGRLELTPDGELPAMESGSELPDGTDGNSDVVEEYRENGFVKTPEQLYDEEQAAIDRETRRVLRQQEDERKMEHLPSDEPKQPVVHEVKIGATFFKDAASGLKNFELRKNDRGYKPGDILELQEYRDGVYTGRTCRKAITYVLEDYTGLEEGYCILGCELIEAEKLAGNNRKNYI